MQEKSFQPKLIAVMVAMMYSLPAAAENQNLTLNTIEVISTTPLPGIGIAADEVPANIQTVSGEEMQNQHSLTIADFMTQNMTGVNVNETQNNPFQPNVNFRGFTASPLIGRTPGR